MAILQCEKCGFIKTVPERYLDTRVRCPQCGTVTLVQPDAEDLGLDDVIGDGVEDTESGEHAAISAEDLIRDPDHPLDEAPGLFEGGALKNLLAGSISGVLTFLVSVSIAGLVFAGGPLAGHFPHAVSMALVCAVVMSVVVALRSGIAFSAAGPETMAGLFLFIITASVSASMAGADPQAVYATALASMFVAAMLVGLCMLAVGASGGADYARYVPIQAIGGVLAGVGLMMVTEGLRIATAGNACPPGLSVPYMGLTLCIKWAPAAAFGLALFILIRWVRNSYALIALVLAAVGAFYGWLHFADISPDQARAMDLLFEPYAQDRFWAKFTDAAFLERIDWMVILDHSGQFIALAGLMLASAMIRVTEMEIADSRPLNLNREFTALGLGNLASALAGGMPGTLSHDRSLARRSAGARGRFSGLVSALVIAPGLVYAHLIMPWMPRFVPAGVIIALGLGLLWRWLVVARSRFTQRGDYGLLWLVFLITASLGLVTGLAVGAGLAMLVTAGRYGSVSVVKHDMSGAHFRSKVDRGPMQIATLKAKGDAIYALTLQGFIFLGTTNSLMEMIARRATDTERAPLRYVLLDFTFISGLDSSVAVSFVKLKQLGVRRGFTLIFTNVPFEMEAQLGKAGCVLDDPSGGSITVISLDYALEWAENQLLDAEGVLAVGEQSLASLLDPVFPEKKYIPALMKILKQVKVKKGKPVFRQGDPSDAMYFIEKGMVNVQLELEGGKLLRLKKMGPGTVFGEMGLYTSAPRTASIIAAEDCVLYRLSTKVMELLQAKRPDMASAIHRFIVSLLADRVGGANDTIRDLLR